MVKRIKLGLNFFFDNQSNSGVVNYIYNIIEALNSLEEAEKPDITIFYSVNAPINYLKELNYPYIKFLVFNPTPSFLLFRKLNSLVKKISNYDFYLNWKYFNYIDCLYPYFEFNDHWFKGAKNKIHWLVDFNNKSFPEHYKDNGEAMNNYQLKITSEKSRLVLSSNSLLEELKLYYPNYRSEIKILRFASTLKIPSEPPNFLHKFNLKGQNYFMSPNQFWAHKNQSVVVEAIGIIKVKRPELKFKVLFTGSLQVNRGKGLYIDSLLDLVKTLKVDSYVQFLGVIERSEQLWLMKKSLALIQPSFYEGWSTLVEEAKALNKFIILSELPVHKEQIQTNVSFFNPKNANDLALKMINQMDSPYKEQVVNYNAYINSYGRALLDAFTF